MKRTPLTRRTPLSRGKRLSPVSKKGAKRQRLYSALRRVVLERDDETCQRCGAPATDTHHLRGRVGDDLLDADLLVSLCRPCHDWVGHNPAEAYESGWLLKRNRGAA